MNVGKLIIVLQRFDPKLPVVAYDNEGWGPVEVVRVEESDQGVSQTYEQLGKCVFISNIP